MVSKFRGLMLLSIELFGSMIISGFKVSCSKQSQMLYWGLVFIELEWFYISSNRFIVSCFCAFFYFHWHSISSYPCTSNVLFKALTTHISLALILNSLLFGLVLCCVFIIVFFFYQQRYLFFRKSYSLNWQPILNVFSFLIRNLHPILFIGSIVIKGQRFIAD